jgi:hypothetical protein
VPACTFAADGQILINQATVNAAGGFPYVISQAGSYRLSGNLAAPSGDTTVIEITHDLVTIDLNGFSIIHALDVTVPNRNVVVDFRISCAEASSYHATPFKRTGHLYK